MKALTKSFVNQFCKLKFKEEINLLGMEDGVITFVWIATVISAVGCTVFGAVMWNKGGEDSK